MPDFDPALLPVECALLCTNMAVRQEIILRLPNKAAWETLQKQILDKEVTMTNILLANGEQFLLDLSTVWYAYQLPSFYGWDDDTLRMGWDD